MKDEPQPGPQRNTLLNLKAMLPSLFRGLKDGSIGKRVQKAQLIRQPRKFCVICGKAWDHVFVKLGEETDTKTEHCGKCAARLQAGETAFVCQDHFVFAIMPDRFSDMRGEVVPVSLHVMDQLQAQYKVEVQTKTGGNGETPNK